MAKKDEKRGNNSVNKEIQEMFVAGVHFGYSRQSRHPKMKPYIFGVRNNVEIFDLEKTHTCLETAKNFLTELAKGGKKILIVATKPGIHQLVEKMGKDLAVPYVSERWLGGTLTNFKIIKDRLDYFINLRKKRDTGELNKYTKKEISRFNKELGRLERFFGGLEYLNFLPSALLIIDSKKEKTALRESFQMAIPVTAILNSDSDPAGIDYPIPANDASSSSVHYLLNQLTEAYKKGLVSFNVFQNKSSESVQDQSLPVNKK